MDDDDAAAVTMQHKLRMVAGVVILAACVCVCVLRHQSKEVLKLPDGYQKLHEPATRPEADAAAAIDTIRPEDRQKFTAEVMLARRRKEAAIRAAAYRAAISEALPSLSELEAGLGSTHASVKPPIPHFKELESATIDAKSGAITPGRVLAPKRSPPDGSPRGEFGWGTNRYVLPLVGYNATSPDDAGDTDRIGRLVTGLRELLWTTPRTERVDHITPTAQR